MTNKTAPGTKGTASLPPPNVYLPARAGRISLEEYERRSKNPNRVSFGVDNIDEELVPLGAGDLVSVLGRPGHGKTSMALHITKHAERILSPSGQYVLYATWETLIEEYVALLTVEKSGQSLEKIARGMADIGKIRGAIISGISSKVAIFGRSLVAQPGVAGIPGVEDLDNAIGWMNANGLPVGLAVVDYLQRMPSPVNEKRQRAVTENLERLKDITISRAVPVLAMVQARREVDEIGGEVKIPRLGDGQHTSAIEQTSDKVLGITRPFLTKKAGTESLARMLELDGRQYLITETTMVVAMLKQRWAKSGGLFVCDLDPTTYTLSEATDSTAF